MEVFLEEPVQHAMSGAGKAARGERQVSVLIVEDNPGDARLIELMINDADPAFNIERADRLGAGLRAVETGHIDIVLLDLSLPDSHGLDTFTLMHSRVPHVPIIVLSGLNDTRLALQAVHRGAQDYLIKGQVEGQVLVRAMRYAMERKRLTEQLHSYAEELRSKNAQLEADFNMAREIQQIFLPHEYPSFPHWASPTESALKFSHRYLPAAAVGGDFFDIFALSDTAAGVFICDVMGHGMRAALVTAIMRGLIEELMPIAADPGRFIAEINRSLHAILRRTREPFLATAFYLVADVGTQELRFCSAGHPSPFKLQRSPPRVQVLKTMDARHGPALGLFERASYPTVKLALSPKDSFLLFTDGLYEVDNDAQEEYGMERLQTAIERAADLPLHELLDSVLRDVQNYSSSEFKDDVCLVSLEVAHLPA